MSCDVQCQLTDSAAFGQHDLVLWGASGWALVVQNYRSLFRLLAEVDDSERATVIRERTVALCEPEGLDCFVVNGERILGARAAVSVSSYLSVVNS